MELDWTINNFFLPFCFNITFENWTDDVAEFI